MLFCEVLARPLWLLLGLVELLLIAVEDELGEVELAELLESEPLPEAEALPDSEPEALRPEDEFSELVDEELGELEEEVPLFAVLPLMLLELAVLLGAEEDELEL